MKKRFKKILMWDHFSQVIFVASIIPSIILWIRGQGTTFTGFIIGWNLGCAVYWQFYLAERKRTKLWMDRALNRKAPDIEVDKLLHIAERLVESRLNAGHIDPDRN